ncbi:MAG TPA: glycoside hydrolase family 88 protein [Alloacidobacterium sp.]|nr:glycoside hydrolase family 88 protein [Alloacidobacterium sp.]
MSQGLLLNEPKPPVGDQPENPGKIAGDLSPELRPGAVRAVMRRVADWQLKRLQAQPAGRSWEFGTLDIGFMAASRTLGDPRYSQYVASVGERYGWQLENTPNAANDFAVAQAFLELYAEKHDPQMIAPLRDRVDAELPMTDDYTRFPWYWSDALFMEPPIEANLARITGDPKYIEFLDHEWLVSQTLFYDRERHLFSETITFLDKYREHGEKIFWSRGNGWVMSGIVRVLDALPENSPSRHRYEQLLREMAAKIASIQGNDGLWRSDLLNPNQYPYPEISGSAFFVYAMAWGINHHVLDAKVYRPVVEKAWGGMLTHIYEDGRLGGIQHVGYSPEAYKPGASYVYGVGAFLLACSELDRTSQQIESK